MLQDLADATNFITHNRVRCLALGGVDLISPAGKMTIQVISAVAEFERDLLIERTDSGISIRKEFWVLLCTE